MRRVVVTGLGVVAPGAQTVADLFAGLVQARSGIRPVVPPLVPVAGSLVAGQVTFDPAAHWPAYQAAQYDRATQFALVAALQAVSDAGLVLDAEGSTRAGVYWGTGLGGATTMEDSYRNLFATENGRVRPSAVVLGMNNAAAAHISIVHGLRGPLLNVSTACSSSAASVGEAFRAIQWGQADVIVAGGSEALITYGNLCAWDAMRALAHADPADPARSCKPFSADRTGLVLGEGAAALILESSDRAEARGAHIYAEIAGYGNASDACGISKPDANGQIRAMRLALADAGLSPDAIGYVNAHGTATQVGDVVETSAIKAAFGAHAGNLCVSSTKALHGHLMGATGALELLVSVVALEHGVIPPTAHLDRPDPHCDLDFVPNQARERRLSAVMSNSFGFGGMNAVLIAQRYRQ
ncbi:MAG TPA: beta-ketoacyl-[acyl-carrier-protein] synthase family protein [Gemmatimonadaceae bacterium]